MLTSFDELTIHAWRKFKGLNLKIKTRKIIAWELRNKDQDQTVIHFHCGGLYLHPVGPRAPE